MCHAISRPAIQYRLRFAQFVIQSDESFSVGIKALHVLVDRIVGIMIASLLVFGLMIQCREIRCLLNLDLSGREVTLEILIVGSGIPQTPLGIRE